MLHGIFYQLQCDRPALAGLNFIIAIAKQIKRNVKTFGDFLFVVVVATTDQEFGGSRNLRYEAQEFRKLLGQAFVLGEGKAGAFFSEQQIYVGTKLDRRAKDFFFKINFGARPGITLGGF